jgi:hypothetical protein
MKRPAGVQSGRRKQKRGRSGEAADDLAVPETEEPSSISAPAVAAASVSAAAVAALSAQVNAMPATIAALNSEADAAQSACDVIRGQNTKYYEKVRQEWQCATCKRAPTILMVKLGTCVKHLVRVAVALLSLPHFFQCLCVGQICIHCVLEISLSISVRFDGEDVPPGEELHEMPGEYYPRSGSAREALFRKRYPKSAVANCADCERGLGMSVTPTVVGPDVSVLPAAVYTDVFKAFANDDAKFFVDAPCVYCASDLVKRDGSNVAGAIRHIVQCPLRKFHCPYKECGLAFPWDPSKKKHPIELLNEGLDWHFRTCCVKKAICCARDCSHPAMALPMFYLHDDIHKKMDAVFEGMFQSVAPLNPRDVISGWQKLKIRVVDDCTALAIARDKMCTDIKETRTHVLSQLEREADELKTEFGPLLARLSDAVTELKHQLARRTRPKEKKLGGLEPQSNLPPPPQPTQRPQTAALAGVRVWSPPRVPESGPTGPAPPPPPPPSSS